MSCRPPPRRRSLEYQTELALRVKKLAEYEAAQILDLELIMKLEVWWSELRTQRSQAEEQLCEVGTRLTEAEGMNRQLPEQTRDALTAKAELCLRGYVLWQIESHNKLWLHKIEHRAAELIARSGQRHRRLAKKLKAYLLRSRDAVAKSGVRASRRFEKIRFRVEVRGSGNCRLRRTSKCTPWEFSPLNPKTRSRLTCEATYNITIHAQSLCSREVGNSNSINSYLQPLEEAHALDVEAPSQIYTTPYFLLPGGEHVFHGVVDLRTDTEGRVQIVVQAIEGRLANAPTSPLQPTVLFRDPNPIGSLGGGGSLSPPDSSRGGSPFPPNPPRGGGGGGGPPDRPMANPQGNPHPSPFTKHSYPT
ncbi:hypothetical protein AXG93_1275s1130 [Marchantia polymorpha subsp. ruderalis]|uniref:Uncharacterized protein n=1 Tax=Marchantia polymorpha subsp. ruderalis TaxID=1480154 RepID=A0A176VMZ9_MARPO|nr:hypothetical protein AXG93_1275s1130 [Marchantia polymorpha subsp. ruderalis]